MPKKKSEAAEDPTYVLPASVRANLVRRLRGLPMREMTVFDIVGWVGPIVQQLEDLKPVLTAAGEKR